MGVVFGTLSILSEKHSHGCLQSASGAWVLGDAVSPLFTYFSWLPWIH